MNCNIILTGITVLLLTLINRRIDINGTENETEPVSDGQSSSQSLSKRPVSMYEQRLGLYGNRAPEFRATTSMYQMAADKSSVELMQPFSEEVKHRTDLVTKRLKEICQALQDVTDKGAFVPCAERLRIAVAELIAIFPMVSKYSSVILIRSSVCL